LEAGFVTSRGEEFNRGFLECFIRINFDINVGRAACDASSGNVELRYKLSICSRIQENHGKP
jgi:hypothetical protein